MTLSTEHIQQLFDFIRRKYVHFYDLQSEIVDHLAAAIEDKMSGNKKLSFEQALDEVYRDFGIFGFAHVVREKEKQLDRQAQRMLWKEVVSLFTWPYLLLSMLILISLYTLTLIISMEVVVIITFVVSVSYFSICAYKTIKSPKSLKKLRMLNYYQPAFTFIPFIYSQLFFNINLNIVSSESYIVFTFLTVIYLIASYRVNAKIKSNAIALYPEAFSPSVTNS